MIHDLGHTFPTSIEKFFLGFVLGISIPHYPSTMPWKMFEEGSFFFLHQINTESDAK
jgi:hypothetical protein